MAISTQGSPLKPVQVHVLLSLLDGHRHGYGIVKDIQARTADAVRLEPGNLYRVLRRLLELDYIREAAKEPTPESGDERRRYYRVTPKGRRALTGEVARMKALVAAAEAGLGSSAVRESAG